MTKPLNLYIHIPFCNIKCKYCAFYTLPRQNTKFKAYFEALYQEVELYKTHLKGYSLKTIYLGGGTPSLVDPLYIKDLLRRIYATVPVEPDAEITMEANPESLNSHKLTLYKQTPINRLSIGLQAWQNHLLTYLGRTYKNTDFVNRIKLVKTAGFTNFNIDLIFGIPGQTLNDWHQSLTNVIALNPNHISCYSLELDNNSFFGTLYKQGKLIPLEESKDRHMYSLTKKLLKESGFHQYELSNYAKPGFECQHNLLFWKGLPYLGLGAGAHSFFQNTHFHNIESINRYINLLKQDTLPTQDHFSLNQKQFLTEKILVGLRLKQGIAIHEFNTTYNTNLLTDFRKPLQFLSHHKLLSINSKTIRLTRRGEDLDNQVALAFA